MPSRKREALNTDERPAQQAALDPIRVADLERVCQSILLSLLQKWRGHAPLDLERDVSLREGVAGLDSLELLEAVGDLNRRFALHETGIEDHLLMSPTIGEWSALLAQHLKLKGPKARLIFSSSGSHGEPEHVAHALPSLLSEVRAIASKILGVQDREEEGDPSKTSLLREADQAGAPRIATDLCVEQCDLETSECLTTGVSGAEGRIVSLVAPQHIFGFLFTVLLPSELKLQVLDLSRSAPGRLFRTLRPGDIVVATPHQLELALDASPLSVWPEGAQVILSGAAVPLRLWNRSKALCVPLIEVYGATQTAGIGWRRGQDQPFTLFADIDRFEHPCEGPAKQHAVQLRRRNRSLEVQDALTWVGARHFHLGPRHDRNVQIGGVNVAPQAVARVLEKMPQVASASVRLDEASERLKAFVVPATRELQVEKLETELRQHAAAQLTSAERPQTYRFGDALPITASGKPSDW